MKQKNQLFKKLLFAFSLITGHCLTYAWSNNSSNFDSDAIDAASVKVQTVKLSTGIELQYAERGNSQGTTIIFLHGLSDAWHSFEKVLDLLPEQFHLVAVSQRGHGNSSKPLTGYHPQDFAAD